MMSIAQTEQKSFFTKDMHGRFGGEITAIPSLMRVEIINHALNAYGYLIDRNERVAATAFAARIRRSYDCVDCPQNAAVVHELEQLL